MHQGGGHDTAIAFGLLDGDHALGAAAMAGVFVDRCAFAVAVFGGGENAGAGHVGAGRAIGQGRKILRGHQHGDHALAVFNHHAAHTTGAATQRAHIVFVKAHGFAAIREQHHIVLAVGEGRANQEVAIVEVDRDDAALARVVEFVKRCFLHRAHGRGHEHKLVGGEAAGGAGERQHHVDFFAFL